MRRAWVVLLAAPVLLGCTPAGQPAALEASRAFQQAVASADPGAACRLLAEETRRNLESASTLPCTEALPRLALPADPPQSVEVWGENAQVRTSSSVLFLAEFAGGWRVTGVGCRWRPDLPYDCTVEG